MPDRDDERREPSPSPPSPSRPPLSLGSFLLRALALALVILTVSSLLTFDRRTSTREGVEYELTATTTWFGIPAWLVLRDAEVEGPLSPEEYAPLLEAAPHGSDVSYRRLAVAFSGSFLLAVFVCGAVGAIRRRWPGEPLTRTEWGATLGLATVVGFFIGTEVVGDTMTFVLILTPAPLVLFLIARRGLARKGGARRALVLATTCMGTCVVLFSTINTIRSPYFSVDDWDDVALGIVVLSIATAVPTWIVLAIAAWRRRRRARREAARAEADPA